jgi:subtilisin family serine protease
MTKRLRFCYLLPAFVACLVLGVLLTGRSLITPKVSAQSPLASVIVELAGDPVVVAKARAQAQGRIFDTESYRQQVIAEQQQFLTRLTAAGVPYRVSSVTAPNGPATPTIEYRYNYVYNGIALEAPQQIMPIIAALPGVLGVHPNLPMQLHLDRAIDYTRASQLYGNPPRLTQFDTLSTGGLEGEGVNIAVIDSGVDWTHEMFGGDPTPPQFGVSPSIAAAGPNRKVIYYLNLTAGIAGDDFGHGTHVAADAAGYRGFAPGRDGIPGTADDVAVHGAAPQAKIMAYKIFTAAGTTASVSVLSAIEDAVQPRTITGQPKPVAHVINMSFGTTTPVGPDDPTAVAVDNAALAGAICIASAGNSGPGEGTIGSPASARRVITVGANTDPASTPNSIDVIGGGRTDMRAFLMDGAAPINDDITNNYVFCGLGDTPDQVPDSVSGKIALIQRGSTVTAQGQGTGQFSVKAALAAAKGAVAALIYNNVDGELSSATVRRGIIPVFGLSKETGEYLKSLIGSATSGAVSAQQVRINKAIRTFPDMADFSSRGPVVGFGQVKPDVTAPGIAILSATVAAGGVETNTATMFDPTRYISAAGTSFSGPITAGIAALIRQKHPDWTPSMVRAALVNTASNLRLPTGAPVANGVNSINEQGGGLVAGLAAASTKAVMGVGRPAPVGQPLPRSFGILAQPSAGNPDFTPSYSFGVVPIANVSGTATLSQEVWIFDVTGGGGAGTYQLDIVPVRSVDQNGFRVSITDANQNPISSVEVSPGGGANFFVKTEANGQSIAIDPTQFQWYVTATRIDGGGNLRMPFYYRAVRPTVSMFAPSLGAVSGAEVSGSQPIDINGSYSLAYAATGSNPPARFRIEEQKDGNQFVLLTEVSASQTTHAIADRGNGLYGYRVAGLFTVQYGLLQGPYSAVQSVQVNRRLESEVTSMIQTAVSGVSFIGGVFEFDQTLKNTSSGSTILPPLRFSITAIQSTSGTVRATNADNSGNGVESAATWDYSNTLGADRALTPNETSSTRHLKFSDAAAELFTFTAVIKGHFPDPAFSALSVENNSSSRKKFKVRLLLIADPVSRTISLAGIQ